VNESLGTVAGTSVTTGTAVMIQSCNVNQVKVNKVILSVMWRTKTVFLVQQTGFEIKGKMAYFEEI
jgi:hypothetical protein